MTSDLFAPPSSPFPPPSPAKVAEAQALAAEVKTTLAPIEAQHSIAFRYRPHVNGVTGEAWIAVTGCIGAAYPARAHSDARRALLATRRYVVGSTVEPYGISVMSDDVSICT